MLMLGLKILPFSSHSIKKRPHQKYPKSSPPLAREILPVPFLQPSYKGTTPDLTISTSQRKPKIPATYQPNLHSSAQPEIETQQTPLPQQPISSTRN